MLIRIRQWAAAALVTLAVAGLVVAVSGNPAYAADIPCPANVVCTYADTNYHGAMYYYSALGTCTVIGPDWSGRISSIKNNKTLDVRAHYNICSTHIWNTTIGALSGASFGFSQLNDHVHSLSYA